MLQNVVSQERSELCVQINAKSFYKLIASLWLCIARHAQSTQNNKFTISLQYLKENVNDEFDFLPADKHERFLQIDIVILGDTMYFYWDGQAFQKLPK